MYDANGNSPPSMLTDPIAGVSPFGPGMPSPLATPSIEVSGLASVLVMSVVGTSALAFASSFFGLGFGFSGGASIWSGFGSSFFSSTGAGFGGVGAASAFAGAAARASETDPTTFTMYVSVRGTYFTWLKAIHENNPMTTPT